MVKYCQEEYECVLFSDGEVYIHNSSIVPSEFPNLQTFQQFLGKNETETCTVFRWIDGASITWTGILPTGSTMTLDGDQEQQEDNVVTTEERDQDEW